MKLQFKHQKFQAEAAKAVVDVFVGQPYSQPSYMMDQGLGVLKSRTTFVGRLDDDPTYTGWSNARIVPELSDGLILEHVQKIQRGNQIAPSPKLEGRYNLTVEMETGVGKTYTYIKLCMNSTSTMAGRSSLLLCPASPFVRVYINPSK